MGKRSIAGPNISITGDPKPLEKATQEASQSLRRFSRSADAAGSKAGHALNPATWFKGGKMGGAMGRLSGGLESSATRLGGGFAGRFTGSLLGGISKGMGSLSRAVGGGLGGGLVTGGLGIATMGAATLAIGGLVAGALAAKLAFSGLQFAITSAVSVAETVLTRMVDKMMEVRGAIDDQAKFSDAVKISTENLARLEFAGGLAGVGVDQLHGALMGMTATLGGAQMGLKKSQKIFKALGVDYRDLSNMDTGQAFTLLAQRIAAIPDVSERAAAAIKMFGDSGPNAVNMVAAGLGDAANEADLLGLSLSRLDSAAVEAMNDDVERLQAAWTGLARQLTAEVAPYIAGTLETILAWIEGDGGIPAKFDAAFNAITETVVPFTNSVIDGFFRIEESVLSLLAKCTEFYNLIPKIASFIINPMGGVYEKIGDAIGFHPIKAIKNAIGGAAKAGVGMLSDKLGNMAKEDAKTGTGVSGFLQSGADRSKDLHKAIQKKGGLGTMASDFLKSVKGGILDKAKQSLESRAAAIGTGEGFLPPEEKDKAKKDNAFGTGSILYKALTFAKAPLGPPAYRFNDNANARMWRGTDTQNPYDYRPGDNAAARMWRGAQPSAGSPEFQPPSVPVLSTGKQTQEQILTQMKEQGRQTLEVLRQINRKSAPAAVMG